MTTADGIDVSHYQTLTGAPYPSNLKFGTAKFSEGKSYTDPKAAQMINSFRAANMVDGGFHYMSPGVSAKDQFANYQAQCKAVGGCFFHQIDWEATKRNNVDVFPDLQTVLDFESMCQDTWPGKVTMYVSPWVTGFAQWYARPGRSPLWLADYSANGQNHARQLGAVMLQYTSSLMLPSFTGRCDGNIIMDMAWWDQLTGVTPPPPTPPSEEDEVPNYTLYRGAGARQIVTSFGPGGLAVLVSTDFGSNDEWGQTLLQLGKEMGMATGQFPPTIENTSDATIDGLIKRATGAPVTVNVSPSAPSAASVYNISGTATPA